MSHHSDESERRYSRADPIESLSAYVMVHGGVDRHDRLLDIEWLRDLLKAVREAISPELVGDTLKQDAAITLLRRLLRERYSNTHLS